MVGGSYNRWTGPELESEGDKVWFVGSRLGGGGLHDIKKKQSILLWL